MNFARGQTAIRVLCSVVVGSSGLWAAEAHAAGTKARAGSYVDVRTYLPEGYVTGGSVDYREQIQKCFDENAYIYFPGSNDPGSPMIYGSMTGLETRPFSVVRFGTNAVLRRLPSFGQLLKLGRGTHLIGAVIDGNKYAHWPLLKDREIKPYAYTPGHGVVLGGQNVIKDCFVYNLAGIAFGAWSASDNKIYRSRAENCGFLEAMGDDFWSGEHASGDGFLFFPNSHNNIVKDCEAYDCTRWGYVIEGQSTNNTFVDCRGGNIHFTCYGFIDVEGEVPNNSLVRCRSHNSRIQLMGSQNDLFGCVASQIDAENASFVRIMACTTTGGPILVGGDSAMVLFNRVFMSRPYAVGGMGVVSSDGKSIVANNTVYAYHRGSRRGGGLVLRDVAVNSGNQVAFGTWDKEIAQFEKPYYLRAHVDLKFLGQRKREVGELRLKEYLSKLGIEGRPTHQQMLIGEFPFAWDEEDMGEQQGWFEPARRPESPGKGYIGRHWRTDHVYGPLPVGWHFVTFDLPGEHVGRRVFLHFGAVDGFATVYLNGRRVGTHDGNTATSWDQPFHFEVTDRVKAGGNDLAMRIAPNMLLGGPFRPISIVVE